MKAIELFSGCGGFSLGFRWAGINVLQAYEIDQWAGDTYAENHPETELIRGDIRSIPDKNWTDLSSKGIDIVFGGPPCQGFSVSGKRQKGEIIESTNLVSEFMRIVNLVKPKYFVLENVVGFKSGLVWKGKHALDFVLEEAKKSGYCVDYSTLEAVDFGVPSIRSRVFVIGSINHVKKIYCNPIAGQSNQLISDKNVQVSCLDAISDLPSIAAKEGTDGFQPYGKPPENDYQKFMRVDSEGVYNHEAMRHTDRLISRFRQIEQGSSAYRKFSGKDSVTVYKSNNQRLYGHKPSLCITANFQSNFIHPICDRNLTAREAARLMSFPDNYIFKGKRTLPSRGVLLASGRANQNHLSQYNQIGNAVPPLLSKAIGLHILDNC